MSDTDKIICGLVKKDYPAASKKHNKSIAIITKQAPENEKYLVKPLSIAMFFYCIGEEQEKYLTKRYPNMPWLKELCGWQMDEAVTGKNNIELMSKAIREVVKECRLE